MDFDALQEVIGNVDSAVGVVDGSAKTFRNIAGAVSAVKSLFGGVKAAGKDDVDNAILEVERRVFEAEKANFTLEKTLLAVQRQLAEAKKQNSQLSRYHLIKFGTGDFAYELNPKDAAGEPAHCVCAPCYEDGVRSILNGESYLTCPRCKHVTMAKYLNRI